jgi:Endoglucanase
LAALCAIAAFALAAAPAFAATGQKQNNTAVFDDIPADKIAQTLSPGWNLGNQLEGVKIVVDAASGSSKTIPSETGYCATKISRELIHAVKLAGFKFVRIPVSYFAYIDDANGYKIDPAWLGRIKEVVDWCVAEKLYCMINMHGDGYTTIKNAWLLCAAQDQKPILEKYSSVWAQVAAAFKGYDESLIFESMNEEFDGSYSGTSDAAYESINAYNEAFVKAVRASGGNNAKRWLLVAGWNTNVDQTISGLGTAGHFRLPADKHLMVSMHYYDPWGFCGGENGTATEWGSFAAKPDKVNGYEASMAKQFDKIRDAFTSKGIPVVIGEWGSIDKSSDDSDSGIYRAYFARKLCENSKRVGAVPVVWDNGWNGKYGFALFNRGEKADEKGNIVPKTVAVSQQGIIDAIMGVYASGAKSKSKATIAFDESAKGMELGQTSVLSPSLEGDGADDKVSWASSDETVAVVWDGIVKSVGSGSCTITATLPNGKSATCAVKVASAGGVQVRVYLFEGAGWSAVKSEPLVVKAGEEGEYEAKFNASELVLRNIAALYIKDLEVEENHAAASEIASCSVTVESFSVNGVAVPLVNNEKVEAVNGKKQFDLPIINEWAPDIEMVAGFPKTGNRDLASVVKGLALDKDKNEIRVKFKTQGGAKAQAKIAAPKPSLDQSATYHAFLGIQAADSWVFRNSYGNNSYGGDTKQFKDGLFDTENAKAADGHEPGTVVDAAVTKSDVEAGKTFVVSCTDFDFSDKYATPKAFNVAMISTDIPYGTVKVTGAKLFLDGVQVNLKDGADLYAADIENKYLVVTFINIWNNSLKTFGYQMPAKEIRMELSLALE